MAPDSPWQDALSDVTLHPLSGHVGAEVEGVDLRDLTPGTVAAVQAALFTHGVIVFRDQSVTPEDHIALAQSIGPIDINRFFTPVADHPQIAEVRTEAHHDTVIGGSWHTDHSYDPAPAMASILVAHDVPPQGGDTMFASQVAALDLLSDGLRGMLQGLWAWHSDGSFADTNVADRVDGSKTTDPVRHPVVIAHPQTGQPALYVNGDFTTHFDGWTPEESAPLLHYLYATCTRAEITCRVRWRPGTVAIWDNRLVQHLAIADYLGHRRLMHRITIAGQPLAPAAG